MKYLVFTLVYVGTLSIHLCILYFREVGLKSLLDALCKAGGRLERSFVLYTHLVLYVREMHDVITDRVCLTCLLVSYFLVVIPKSDPSFHVFLIRG